MSYDEYLKLLRSCGDKLNRTQYMALKGQARAGDITGAIKGLNRLLRRLTAAK